MKVRWEVMRPILGTRVCMTEDHAWGQLILPIVESPTVASPPERLGERERENLEVVEGG